MEKTKTELLKEANDKISQVCFEAGRTMYSIKLKEEELDGMRRTLSNLDVDWRKAHEAFGKAFDAHQKELKEKPNAVTASPALEMVN